MEFVDTIAAISTPLGEGGIGIIRVSGKKAIEVVEKIFRLRSPKKKSLSSVPSHRLYYGYIVDPQTEEIIDEVLVSIMRAPHSYTTEDVVEINAHGGVIILKRILELILKEGESLGVRLAEPGEFTKRAYLAGRIDLAQAEAVATIIRSQTELAAKNACRQLMGALSEKIERISNCLTEKLAEIEASLDFPEEDIPELQFLDLKSNLKYAKKEISQLLNSANFGQIIDTAAITPIIGKPNVGKSSLFNQLVGKKRAIVTPIPGTTRDTINARVNISEIPFEFIDTAGLREACEIIELEGIKRTNEVLEEANLIIFVLDISQSLQKEDLQIINKIKEIKENNKIIIALNKSDLPQKLDIQIINDILHGVPMVKVSALTGEGIEELKKCLVNQIIQNSGYSFSSESILVTNLRHIELLTRAKRAIERAEEILSRSKAKTLEIECISLDIREAINYLNEILGKNITSEDILNKIFSQFCIGK